MTRAAVRPVSFRPLLPWLLLALVVSSCSGPKYREIRRPAPGGGYYVQRVLVKPGEAKAARQARKRTAPVDDGSYWLGDGVEGKPAIRIVLSEQRMYFSKGGRLVGVSPISSGRESHATRPGRFRIQQKNRDHKSNLYGDYVDAGGLVLKKDIDVRKDPRPRGARFDGAPMRHFMRITGAIGMHEGYLPGFPASHGCIRLPGRMAEIFFREAQVGTPVEIVP